MNVLHVSAQKPDSTGSGVYLSRVVEGFARLGANQAVIAGISLQDSPSFPAGVLFRPVLFGTDELPFPVVGMSDVMPYEATRYRDLTPAMTAQFKRAFAGALDSVLEQFIPDVVVCHHLYIAAAVIVERLRERAHNEPDLAACKVVAISHSTDIRQMQRIPLERDFVCTAMGKLDAALALHDPQAREIAQVYGLDASKIHVIGTGYNDEIFYPVPGKRIEGARTMVYVGKIWRRKGVESLVRAIGLLSPEQAPTRTVLIGGYNDQDEYERVKELIRECPYDIELAGIVSDEQLVDAYQRANVFVLPSFYEGLPLVLVEAIACGCNAVMTDLPGIREWLLGQLPDAPIRFIAPPAMDGEGEPHEEALPEFEAQLARAIAEALDDPQPTCDTTVLSWRSVCERLCTTLP